MNPPIDQSITQKESGKEEEEEEEEEGKNKNDNSNKNTTTNNEDDDKTENDVQNKKMFDNEEFNMSLKKKFLNYFNNNKNLDELTNLMVENLKNKIKNIYLNKFHKTVSTIQNSKDQMIKKIQTDLSKELTYLSMNSKTKIYDLNKMSEKISNLTNQNVLIIEKQLQKLKQNIQSEMTRKIEKINNEIQNELIEISEKRKQKQQSKKMLKINQENNFDEYPLEIEEDIEENWNQRRNEMEMGKGKGKENKNKKKRKKQESEKNEQPQIQKKIDKMLQKGHVDEAISYLLSSKQEEYLISLCSKLNHETVIPILSPQTVLILLNQFSANFEQNIEIKITWVHSIVKFLYFSPPEEQFHQFLFSVLSKLNQNVLYNLNTLGNHTSHIQKQLVNLAIAIHQLIL